MYSKDTSKILNRIINARKSLNLTYQELADRTGLSKSTLQRYETGAIRNIPLDKLEVLAAGLETTPAYLMGWEEDTSVFRHNNVVPVPEMRQIPLYTGGIACGDPLFVSDETEYISLPKHISADFAVVCKGDSMINAHIKDGSIVYIRKQPTVNNGEIAAVLIDDSATLKRVFLEKNRLTLYPANDAYLPKVYQDEELENVQILGKAVAYTSNV